MATQLIQTTFANTYNDDYSDSDNYYKVLFNNGRSLQQRELNQLQSILNNDIKTNSDFLFQHGAAASGGSINCRNNATFIKLNETVNSLPKDATLDAVTQASAETIEGIVFTEAISSIKFRVDKVVIASGSDPAVIYVTYLDANSIDGLTTGGIQITPDRNFTGTNSVVLTSQKTNTTGINPALGEGTLFEVNEGKFYLEGHFVHTSKQTIVVSKFSSTPDAVIGFKVTEDIVTSTDDENLFDNSGASLNLASPGADRYRLKLTLIKQADIVSGDYFIKLAELVNGGIFTNINEKGAGPALAQGLNEVLAARTFEESGNYTTQRMIVDFITDKDSAAKINVIVNAGTAYVAGNRLSYLGKNELKIAKPRTTQKLENKVSSASFGNYVVITTMKGFPKIDTLEKMNLRDAATHGGNTIGTCRVRAIEKDGANFRFYIFDVAMIATKNFSKVRSIGSSTIIFGDLEILATGVAEGAGNVARIIDPTNNNLFFPLSDKRPSFDGVSDISLTIQQKVVASVADGATSLVLTAGSGLVWDNASQWIVAANDDGVIDTNATVAFGDNPATATVAGLTTNQAHTFIVYAKKAAAGHKSKTLTSISGGVYDDLTPASDGSINLLKTDIFDVSLIQDIRGGFNADISDRYIVDNGARDNFYDVGKLILKAGATAPAGDVKVAFRHFVHGTSGDFFSVNSYKTQVEYEDIPAHRQANGETVQLRDVLDFRPTASSLKVGNSDHFHTGAGSQIIPLPENNGLIQYDLTKFLGQKGIVYISPTGGMGVRLGDAEENPQYPELEASSLKLARIQLNPYMLDDEDGNIEHIDNRRYTMRDIGTIEKRLGQLEEITALTMMEMETSNIDVLDSTGVNRLKAGITADNFQNHFQSDTGLADYRASIDPAKNELRPSFIARPIELVYDSAASSGVVRAGDKVMMAYSQVAWKVQDNASRGIPVNPYGSTRINGTITMSPSSDSWYETEVVSTVVQKGDASFDTSNATLFGNWDFNWSGISDDEAANYKTGDQIGSHAVDGGTTVSTSGSVTTEYKKRETQSYYVSDVSTVKEVIGSKILNRVNIPYMRSRFLSFKATGLRPNTQYFPFFDGVDVSNFCNTTTGIGGFTQYGALSRTSPYLDASNIYSAATTYPAALGGKTAKILTDANGSLSGYFLLPRTDAIKFKAGKKNFTLLDISVHNKVHATSIASFPFESAGILQETEQTVLETENIAVGSESNVVTTPAVIANPATGSVEHDGPDPGPGIGENNHDHTPAVSKMGQSPGAMGGPSECFVPEAKVLMADGSLRQIQNIAIGDKVMSWKGAVNTVVDTPTFTLGENKIHGFNGILPFITSMHPIMTDNGWASFNPEAYKTHWPEDYALVAAENEAKIIHELKEDDPIAWKIGTADVVYSPMDDMTTRSEAADFKVYNLTLDGDKTFVVEDIVVHNKGDGCFTETTQVEMSDYSMKNIIDVKIGDRVFNWDHSQINTVMWVERVPNNPWKQLYSPSVDHEPFATTNHPIYMGNKLAVVDTDTVENAYPWLGKMKKWVQPNVIESADNVYNLWVDGDGTFTVNGFGTTSIIGDGGFVRSAAVSGLLEEEHVQNALMYFQGTRRRSYGAYIINRAMTDVNSQLLANMIKSKTGLKVLGIGASMLGSVLCIKKPKIKLGKKSMMNKEA